MKNNKTVFTIKLADINIKVICLYKTTLKFCKDYLSKEKEEFTIEITENDIENENIKSIHEDIIEGRKVKKYKRNYLETLALYRKIAEKLIDYDILLFHASVLEANGEGFIFSAKSGTGKSTHARLWTEVFGKNVIMINDDKPLLKVIGDKVIAYGTPWNGKHGIGNNKSAIVKGLCFLEKNEDNSILQLDKLQAYTMLIQQSYRIDNNKKMEKILMLLDKIAFNVNMYKLKCNMEKDAPIVAYNGMKGFVTV